MTSFPNYKKVWNISSFQSININTTNLLDNDTLIYSSSENSFVPVSIYELDGPTGPTGPQGPQGQSLQGAQGPRGPTGSKGPVGLTGFQGITGIRGPTGSTGYTGYVGPTGITGSNGVIGPNGYVGPQGSTGPMGLSLPYYSSSSYVGYWYMLSNQSILHHALTDNVLAERFGNTVFISVPELLVSITPSSPQTIQLSAGSGLSTIFEDQYIPDNDFYFWVNCLIVLQQNPPQPQIYPCIFYGKNSVKKGIIELFNTGFTNFPVYNPPGIALFGFSFTCSVNS